MKSLEKPWVGVAIVLVGVLASGLNAQENAYPLWHELEPGANDVGFRLLHVVDGAEEKNRRVVRIGLWYPAKAQSGDRKMVHGDYVRVTPDVIANREFEKLMNEADRESQGRQFFDDNADSHQDSLEKAQVAAIQGAKMNDGKFPLVLHSLGRNGNLFQHTILWEHLASHGFVVATIGQYGKDLEDPWMDFNVEDLQYQLNDLSIALDHFLSRDFVDPARTGIIGHSSGAVLALWLSANRSEIKAVIGLDGSINREEGRGVFEAGLGEKTVSAPFLNICRWPHNEYTDEFMGKLNGEIIRVGFEKGIHFDFQNWPAYQAFADATEPSSMAVRSVDESKNLFVASARFARLFLEQHLKGDETAGELLLEKADELSSGQASIQKIK